MNPVSLTDTAYTVSHHSRRYAAGAAFGAILVSVYLSGCRKPPAADAAPPPTVGVVDSRRMSVPVEATPNGTTRALESVTVQARVRGFLTELHFAEGAEVKKGQLLVVIDEAPYEVALRSARARQAGAEAALRKAVESKGREVAAAQVDLDRAQLLLAQVHEKRTRGLVARSAGSADELDKAEAERKRWESQVEADRAHLDQAKTDHDTGIAAAQAQVAAAAAAVRDAELSLGYCRMYAPIDGRIGEARVKVGNLVGPDPAGGGAFTDLATIRQLDPIGVDLRLSSRDLERTTALTAAGLAVRLTRPGPSGHQDHPHEGRFYFIDNAVDETTSTFLAKARVPNPGGKLLPGEYVKARMVVDRLDDSVVVPAPSVAETDAGAVVHVVDGDGKVAVRRVVAGRTFEGLRVITSGLDAGVPVIVDGLQMVRPGLAVTAVPVGPPRPGSTATRFTAAAAVIPPKS